MPLKNYTSQTPASRSIASIEQRLARFGARQIMKEYDGEGRCEKISFMLEERRGDRVIPVFYKLPAQLAACQERMLQDLSPRAKDETRKKIPIQAERTAWKILDDWVGAQLAMVELAQVEIQQIMLPYAYDPASDKTVWDRVKEKGIAGLLPAPK